MGRRITPARVETPALLCSGPALLQANYFPLVKQGMVVDNLPARTKHGLGIEEAPRYHKDDICHEGRSRGANVTVDVVKTAQGGNSVTPLPGNSSARANDAAMRILDVA